MPHLVDSSAVACCADSGAGGEPRRVDGGTVVACCADCGVSSVPRYVDSGAVGVALTAVLAVCHLVDSVAVATYWVSVTSCLVV